MYSFYKVNVELYHWILEAIILLTNYIQCTCYSGKSNALNAPLLTPDTLFQSFIWTMPSATPDMSITKEWFIVMIDIKTEFPLYIAINLYLIQHLTRHLVM